MSVLSNISEGFHQGTDRAFARHLTIARGSLAETYAQLTLARDRNYIDAVEYANLERLTEQTGKMLTALIHYLRREDRKIRF